MKSINVLLPMLFLLMIGCTGNKQSTNDLITVDVTTKYPYKELILQDFMDVEYIPLETTDEFLCTGYIQAIGENVIIARNRGTQDRIIFIFDRKGKALKTINRRGQGGEEYVSFVSITLDEEKGELFVNDTYSRKIIIYDLEGRFKRKLSIEDDFLLGKIYNFNQDYLICYNEFRESSMRPFSGRNFCLISKQDGSVKDIQIPYKEKKTIAIKGYDETSNQYYAYMIQTFYPIMPHNDGFILTECSTDTLFQYLPDHSMEPFIVRKPSIQSDQSETFLILSLLTDRYYFMETVKKKHNDFHTENLLYDKQEKSLFKYQVYNSDYTYNKEVYLKSGPLNNEILSFQYLEAADLVRDYKRGRLKGKLKEIASKLKEDDNPVIMLIKHKNRSL